MSEQVTLQPFRVFLRGWDYTVQVYEDGSEHLEPDLREVTTGSGKVTNRPFSGSEIRHCWHDGKWQDGWKVQAIDPEHAKTVFKTTMKIEGVNEVLMKDKFKTQAIWRVEPLEQEAPERKKPRKRDAA